MFDNLVKQLVSLLSDHVAGVGFGPFDFFVAKSPCPLLYASTVLRWTKSPSHKKIQVSRFLQQWVPQELTPLFLLYILVTLFLKVLCFLDNFLETFILVFLKFAVDYQDISSKGLGS